MKEVTSKVALAIPLLVVLSSNTQLFAHDLDSKHWNRCERSEARSDAYKISDVNVTTNKLARFYYVHGRLPEPSEDSSLSQDPNDLMLDLYNMAPELVRLGRLANQRGDKVRALRLYDRAFSAARSVEQLIPTKIQQEYDQLRIALRCAPERK